MTPLKKDIYKLIFLIFFCIFCVALFAGYIMINDASKATYENSKQEVLAEAMHVNAELEKLLEKSISAAKSVMFSPLFIQLLKDEDKYSQDEMYENFKKYFSDFEKKLNYSSIFVVFDKSKKYYTNLGYHKTIDVENDPHDIWYKLFLDLNTTFDFDIDSSQAYDDKWTLFTNVRINDVNGNLLAVCGFASDLSYLTDFFKKLEEKRGLKVYFVDSDGNVVLSADANNVKKRQISKAKHNDSNEFKIQEINGHFVATKYIEQIGWTLAVEKKQKISEIFFGLSKINKGNNIMIH